MQLEFDVPGLPVGKKEGIRIRYKRGKGGKLVPYPQVYKTKKADEYMKRVKAHAQLAVIEHKMQDMLPTNEPLAVKIVAFFPRPKTMLPTQVWPCEKPLPDSTNIQKAAEDALHKVIFKDDVQNVDIHTSKRYAQEGAEPFTRVEIWTAGTRRYINT